MYLFKESKADYIKGIIKRKNTIAKGNRHFDHYADTLIEYYLTDSTYPASTILKNVKSVFKNYFGKADVEYQDELINNKIKRIKAKIKLQSEKEQKLKKKQEKDGIIIEPSQVDAIPIYQSELDRIGVLSSQKCKQLGFAFLVFSKYIYYNCNGTEWIFERNADIYVMAGLDKYIDNESNKKKYKSNGDDKIIYLKEMYKCGLIDYRVKYDKTFIYHPEEALFEYKFKVLFKEFKDEAPVFEIPVNNLFDYVNRKSTMLLYYLRWQGDKKVSSCLDCGCPIEKTNNKKSYCRKCNLERNRVRGNIKNTK